MKGHKVNENSIKTQLAFSEITKTCSELNISFRIFFFFNSQYPEPETAETIPSKSLFFKVRMLCQKEGKALIFKGVFSGLGEILLVISSFCLLTEESLIGSDASFLYILP